MEKFDYIVLGGGKGGKTIAIELGRSGKKTAVVEIGMIGGSCINVACIPTKTMINCAKVAEMTRRSQEYGTFCEDIKVQLPKVIAYKNAVVEDLRELNLHSLTHTDHLELILGEGHFIDSNSIEVMLNDGTKRILTADKIIINTGSRPSIPDITGIDSFEYLTSKSIMELTTLPEHLIIIGGGYIGLEFAQMFARFGSKITIINHGPQILSNEDEDVANEIKTYLEQDMITIHVDTQPIEIKKTDHTLDIFCRDKQGKKFTIQGTHLLVATGRKANTEKLNLEAAKVAIDKRGFITVNEKLQTSNPNIWALGDVNGGPQFTHVSFDDFRIVRSQLLEDGCRTTKNRLIPYTLFIDPQLGRVGLTEKRAKELNIAYKVAKMPVKAIPRAKTMGETKGFFKVLVSETDETILGAAILCEEAGEVLGTIQVAMIGKLTYRCLGDAIFSHPTLVEGLNLLFANFSAMHGQALQKRVCP